MECDVSLGMESDVSLAVQLSFIIFKSETNRVPVVLLALFCGHGE